MIISLVLLKKVCRCGKNYDETKKKFCWEFSNKCTVNKWQFLGSTGENSIEAMRKILNNFGETLKHICETVEKFESCIDVCDNNARRFSLEGREKLWKL